jgi:hypothetical protein
LSSPDILSQFSEIAPRETAGARSSNRFDYQKNWSICHFLELHQDDQDYLIVFDHHEDIVVFNHSISPDSACFYQVKSKKSGNWTIYSLAKCKEGDHDSSILRKLYMNFENFPNFTLKMAFVSNQGLNAKNKISGKRSVVKYLRFHGMHINDKKVCANALEKKNKSFSNLSGLKLFEFQCTPLALEDHAAHTKGRLTEFFEDQFPAETINIALAYRTIFDEVKRKTNFENSAHSQLDVIKEKSLSKREFNGMLAVIVNQRGNAERWSDAHQILLKEDCNSLKLMKIRDAWNRAIIDEMDPRNEQFLKVSRAVRLKIENEHGNDSVTILSLSKAIVEELGTTERVLFDVHRVAAMVCREVTKNESLQEANSGVEGQEP